MSNGAETGLFSGSKKQRLVSRGSQCFQSHPPPTIPSLFLLILPDLCCSWSSRPRVFGRGEELSWHVNTLNIFWSFGATELSSKWQLRFPCASNPSLPSPGSQEPSQGVE